MSAESKQATMMHTEAELYAMRLIRAKFQGASPDTVTMAECFNLMLEFGKVESQRADHLMQLCTETLARMNPAPIIVEKLR
jgi:hypothetical protein